MFSCDSSDDTSTGPPPEPPLIGCEAAEVYDWDTVEFETSLNGGANTWIAFSLEELTLFSVVVNQAGFQCTIFNECNGEFGLEPYVFQFETVGNGLDIGIVPEGGYWINILNTRPNRMDFTFRIELSDIAYGCIDDDALNYNELANVDDGSCTYQDCNTDFYLENHPEGMVLDCDGNCAPIDWIGDGYCDDGQWCNLQCYENDGGDCPPSSGDINEDGTVDVLDVIIAVDGILNGQYNVTIDLSNDNIINIVDIILLINIILDN